MLKILGLNPTYKQITLPESSYLKLESQSVIPADRYKFRKFRNIIKNDFSELIFLGLSAFSVELALRAQFFYCFLKKDELY
jgi:hypothetical protein